MFDDLEKLEKQEAGERPASNPASNPGEFLPGSLPDSKLLSPKPVETTAPAVDASVANFDDRIKGLYEKGKKRGKRYSIIGIVGSVIILIVVSIVGYYLWTQVKSYSRKAENREQETINLMAANDDKIKQTAQDNEDNLPLAILPEWTICMTDEECIGTTAGCCPCLDSGEPVVINKSFWSVWDEQIKAKQAASCIDKVCPSEVCQTGTFACEKSRCIFRSSNINVASSSETVSSSTLEGIIPEAITSTTPDITEVSAGVMDDLDSDLDGLTDNQELIYGTDVNNRDTDGDGFSDGDEVKNGYNPNGLGKL